MMADGHIKLNGLGQLARQAQARPRQQSAFAFLCSVEAEKTFQRLAEYGPGRLYYVHPYEPETLLPKR